MTECLKKILVVDDSATIRRLIGKELEKGGYDIVEASNGLNALAKAIEYAPLHLITLDIDMPKLNGFETYKRLKEKYYRAAYEIKEGTQVPVIFITANDSMEIRQKGFEVGAADFITKPFNAGDILDRVNKILKPKQFLKGITALIVDDNKVARYIVRENLEREGVTLLEADNGLNALKILKKNLNKIDIIITDLIMPEMDGCQFCRAVRKQLNLTEIPIIFLTAMSDRLELIKVFQAGATDYLVKPFFKEELLARLNVHMERTQINRRLKQTIIELQNAEQEKLQKQKLEGVLEMAGAVCHELNQPIQAISGFSELLTMGMETDNESYPTLSKIQNQIFRMSNITRKLMSITRYETKAYAGKSKIIDIDKASTSL